MRENTPAVLALALSKTYEMGDATVEALKDVSFRVDEKEFVAVCGSSGSGKTTLLNMISGIDRPTRGKITVFGEDLGARNEDFLTTFRCRKIGFVFQSYNLVSTLTVAENVAFPMEWTRTPADQTRKRAQELLEIVGLSHRADHFPCQLSGGEQQRVGFARALANDPPLLLVDEPTGNLDMKTSGKIIEILEKLKTSGRTVVVATHDERIVQMATQKLCLDEGKLVELNE